MGPYDRALAVTSAAPLHMCVSYAAVAVFVCSPLQVRALGKTIAAFVPEPGLLSIFRVGSVGRQQDR